MQQIRFENWKNGRRIVTRNEKGQLITSRKQKGSGIRTKAQAKTILQKTGTFYKDRARITNTQPQLENKKLKRVTIQGKDGTKSLSLKNKGFRSITKIGKNTAVIRTKKQLKNQEHTQTVVRLQIKSKTWYGYSDLQGNSKQAFLRARSLAINDNVIGYDWSIQRTGENTGHFVSPQGKKVAFKFDIEVQTFVKTNNETFNEN